MCTRAKVRGLAAYSVVTVLAAATASTAVGARAASAASAGVVMTYFLLPAAARFFGDRLANQTLQRCTQGVCCFAGNAVGYTTYFLVEGGRSVGACRLVITHAYLVKGLSGLGAPYHAGNNASARVVLCCSHVLRV